MLDFCLIIIMTIKFVDRNKDDECRPAEVGKSDDIRMELLTFSDIKLIKRRFQNRVQIMTKRSDQNNYNELNKSSMI